MTKPTPPSGVIPEVVEIDAMNLEEWEGAQYTPQVGDAKLEALVKQTAAAPAPPSEAPTATPRTKTQAMPHVVARSPALPPAVQKTTATPPVGVPVAVPLKRTATPPVGVPPLPVAKRTATAPVGVPARSKAPPAPSRPPAEDSEGSSLPEEAPDPGEDDWTDVANAPVLIPTEVTGPHSASRPPVTQPLPRALTDRSAGRAHSKPTVPATQPPPRPQLVRAGSEPRPEAKPEPSTEPRAEPEPRVEATSEPRVEAKPESRAQPRQALQLHTTSRSESHPVPDAQPVPLPPPPIERDARAQPIARTVLGHAPSDEAIPAVRDERFEATDAHRQRTKRRAMIAAAAFAALAILIINFIATRGSSTATPSQPPPPTTAKAPPEEAPVAAPPAASLSTALPAPEPVASANPTPVPHGTRTNRTSSPGHTRTQPGRASSTARDRETPDHSPADDGTRSARARAAYKAGNEKLFAGDTSGAIREYRESASLGYAAGYRGLGLAYAQAGDRARAREALEAYLKRSPNAKDADLIRKRIAALK